MGRGNAMRAAEHGVRSIATMPRTLRASHHFAV